MEQSKRSSAQGMIFLIMAQTIVAISIVSAKFLIASLPIIVLLTIRFSLATVILLPLHWLTPDKQFSISRHLSQLNWKDWGFIIAQALSAGVLFNLLMVTGLHYTDANIAGIITSALPALIAIMSWLVLGEKISRKTIACIIMATIGLIIIASNKTTGVDLNNSVLGNLLIFCSLLPEAAYYILTKLHPNRLPIFLISALLNGINALLLLLCILFIQPNFEAISFQNWLILSFLGLTAGLFYVFWFFGCQKVDGVKASLATAIMPVATVIFAWVLLGEELSTTELMGMSLVILSIIANGY